MAPEDYDIKEAIKKHNISVDDCTSLEECIWSFKQKIQHDSDKRERIYSLFMNSCFGHLVTTSRGMITDVNNAMLQMLGYTERAEVKYKPVIDFIHPDDVYPQDQFIKEVVPELQNGNKFANVRFKHKTGQYIQCRTSVGAVKDHNDDTFVLVYIRMPEDDKGLQ